MPSFSILERIDVGETNGIRCSSTHCWPFSILERIDVGETTRCPSSLRKSVSFSILERIDVGETISREIIIWEVFDFQYPRTDRRG